MGTDDWYGNSDYRRKKKPKPVPVPIPEEIAEIQRIMDLLA